MSVNECRNLALSSGSNVGADHLTEPIEEIESDLETLSEGSVSEYSFGIGEDLEYTASNPPVNPAVQGLGGLSNRGSLGRFQEHLASEENLGTVGPQQPATPLDYPPPYTPVDPSGTHIFPLRPQGFYNPIYYHPRNVNSSFGPDAIEVRGIHVPPEAPSFCRGNFGLPFRARDIYHNPGQERFEQFSAGLSDGTFTRWTKNRSLLTSRIASSVKGLFPSRKPRSIQPDSSETDRATQERSSSPNWFQRWKKGHDERVKRRTETIARLEASQGC